MEEREQKGKKKGKVAPTSSAEKLDLVLKQIDAKYGKGTVIRGNVYPVLPRFSSGVFSIDAEIGGGIPRGRILIFTGNESTGKSTVASVAAASAQKTCRTCGSLYVRGEGCVRCTDSGQPMQVFYADIEGTFDMGWFEALGGDPEALLLFQPEFAEQGVDVIEALIRTGGIDLVIVDSIAMMTPAVEIEKSAEDQMMGNHAKLMNRMMRAIQAGMNSLGSENLMKPSVILINQIREKIGVMFGSPDTMPGGRGQSFASSITLKFFARPSEKLVESTGTKKEIGHQIRFNVEKNKTYVPHKDGIFTLYTDDSEEYGVRKGIIDNVVSIVKYGVRYGTIDKAGSWLTYVTADGEVIKKQGEEDFVIAMEENPAALDELARKTMAAVTGRA